MRVLVTFFGLVTWGASVVTPASQAGQLSRQLFASYDIVQLELRAPLGELFTQSKEDESYSVTGALGYTDTRGRAAVMEDVRVTVRGNTSRRETECPFPKLTLHFAAGPALDTSMFAGFKTLKIGTHCGEEPGGQLTRRFGRLANELAVMREAFIYRLLEAVDVPSLKARPARITYVDPAAGGAALVRNAMLLEDTDSAIERFDAAHDVEMDRFGSAARDLSETDTARLTFAEAMIGNFDWCLRMTPADTYRCNASKPLWNVAVFARDDGTSIPLPYDFDLAGMVTGRHSWFASVLTERFLPSQTEVEVVSQLQRTRSLFSRAVLDATRERFLRQKTDAWRAFEASDLDPKGRQQIAAYLTAFFEAIAEDQAFYRPVVLAPNTLAYRAASGDSVVACANDASVPIGTPVTEAFEHAEGRVRVLLLDALWHWTGKRRCDAVHGDVWIDEHAIGTQYPR
jgi:hypothetical protein